MLILLTGATGLIGSVVADRLRLQHTVVALGRQAGLVDVVVDLSDPMQLEGLSLPGVVCLVHCAGVIDEDFRENPMAAYRRATYGAEALARVAARVGCKRFIYVSSTHVYGAQVGTISEATPVNPQSHYALAHFCTEQFFRQQASANQGSCVVLRPNAVYGLPAHPDRFQRWSLIPFSFPREAAKTGRIVLKSSGLQRRNFVSTAAIADMVTRCVAGDMADATGVINVLGADTESVYDFAQRCRCIVEKQCGRSCAVERPLASLEVRNASAGSDFTLLSRYQQQRPAEELNNFIAQFATTC